MEAIATVVVDSAFKVHSALGPGLLESVYEACLAHELHRRGISFERQVSLPVHYEGLNLDAGLRLDLVVAGQIVVECKAVEALRFNVAVANIHEFSNVLQTVLTKNEPGLAWAAHEAGALLVTMIGPMLPHLAEECWARLGYNTLLANEPWPVAEPDLLVDDQVTIAVQVNGKRRDELVVSRSAKREEVEAAALKLGSVVRALEGRAPKKVIVVPQRIVNVVG